MSDLSTTGLPAVGSLQFDATGHSYTINGVRVPSVTQILKAEGFYPPFNSGDAAYRGTIVHQVTAMIDTWKDASVPPEYQGYVDAYLKFQEKERMEWSAVEKHIYSEKLGYAGTPDRLCDKGVGTVGDIKTGEERPTDGIQIAGYALLAEMPHATRYGIYLHSDGGYKVVAYEENSDFVVWRNAHYNYAWKKKRGVIK